MNSVKIVFGVSLKLFSENNVVCKWNQKIEFEVLQCLAGDLGHYTNHQCA